MRRLTALVRTLPAFFAFLIGASSCSGTETGNPTVPVQPAKLAAITYSNDGSIGIGGGPLTVDGFFQVLDTLALQDCPENAETALNLLDGPTPLDLTGSDGLPSTTVPARDYCGVWLRSIPAEPGLSVPAPLIGDTILLTGVREDGARFEIVSDVEIDRQIRTAQPIPLVDGGIAALMAFDVGIILVDSPLDATPPDADGVVRISLRAADGTLTQEFARAVAASLSLVLDENGNGAFDPGELRLGPP